MYGKKNIILIGMPGSGKSTLGQELSRRLHMKFVDADTLIVQREARPLHILINQRGLETFLQIEEEVICDLHCKGHIIATGGSVPMRNRSMEHLRTLGVIVYLDAPFYMLEKRIGNLTTRGITFAPGQTLKDLYDARTPVYRRWADVTVDVSRETTIEKSVAKIRCALETYFSSRSS